MSVVAGNGSDVSMIWDMEEGEGSNEADEAAALLNPVWWATAAPPGGHNATASATPEMSTVPSIRSLGVAKSVKWADEEGEKLVDTKDNPKWINAPQMVDGERLIDDFDNNSDLYDFDLKPSDAFDIRSLLTTGKVHPEPAAVVHVPHRRGDYKTRENFKMGCLEYIVLACWGVFLVTAGGYIAMRLFQKAHND